jgi:putative endonuclease
MQSHTYYVYILTNKSKTVIYTGVTNNLSQRLQQHKSRLNPKSFTSRYNVYYLLYFEEFTSIKDAIAREKRNQRLEKREEDKFGKIN